MTDYRERKNKLVDEATGASRFSVVLFAAVICVALLVVGYSIWNTVTMRSASSDNARDYVNELTLQIASTVSTDQADHKTAVSGMGDAISMLFQDNIQATTSNEYLASYLESANKSSHFEYVAFLRDDADPIMEGDTSTAVDISKNHPVVEECLKKDDVVAYVDGNDTLFATPVYADNQTIGVVVGAVDNSELRDLVDVQTYRDESNFCMVNREGKLLIASGGERFAQLDSVLTDDAYAQEAAALEDAFGNDESGVIDINFADGEDYFLAYAPVDGEDWVMLTLFPVDLFSGTYENYMVRALVCTVASAIIFVILIVLVRLLYSNSRRKFEDMAFNDSVTGGINEAEFRMRYESMLRTQDPSQYSIVMLDIKNFKLANESFGFQEGDQILKRTYESICKQLDEARREFVARVEMDHYFICLQENTQEGIQRRIDAITKQADKDCFLYGRAFSISFGQGACLVGDASEDISLLQEHARMAKDSDANPSSPGCKMFTEEIQKSVYEDHKLDRKAQQSLENHDFEVYLQPKVSMSTGKVIGAEALVRWNHPKQGLISPAEFIPALEKSGRIREVDRYVFEEVCCWMERHKAAGEPLVPVSVNLSRAHFWEESFVDDYVDIAEAHQVDTGLIEFEITETLFMEEAWHTKIKEGVQHMHSHGFRCAVDDFGVGYSSLSLVHEMDVDTLKFDRSFFIDLAAEKSQIVARNLMNMAYELHMDVVIEGIETQEQIDFLKGEKCDVIQGYFYSKPMPEADFDKWLTQFEAVRSTEL